MKRTLVLPTLTLGLLTFTSCQLNTPPTQATVGRAPNIVLFVEPRQATTPGPILLLASASDADGIERVEFYKGNTLLATDDTAPYTATDVIPDDLTLTSVTYYARAYDTKGQTARTLRSTLPVTLTDNAPTLTLTADPATLSAPGPVTLTVTATDDRGVDRVEFYRGEELLGTDDEAPYELTDDTLPGDAVGPITYRATVYDTRDRSATATTVVTVEPSEPSE